MKLTQHYKSTIHYYKIKIKFKKEAIKILTRGNLQISEKFCAADFPARTILDSISCGLQLPAPLALGGGERGGQWGWGGSLSGSRRALVWLMGFHSLRLPFCSHAQNHILVDLWKLCKVKQALLVETV